MLSQELVRADEPWVAERLVRLDQHLDRLIGGPIAFRRVYESETRGHRQRCPARCSNRRMFFSLVFGQDGLASYRHHRVIRRGQDLLWPGTDIFWSISNARSETLVDASRVSTTALRSGRRAGRDSYRR